MAEKPSDFLIGVGEFIGILLPGTVVVYVAAPKLLALAETYSFYSLTGSAAWVAFAITAYFSGHLVFLLGSFLDQPYDWIRQRFLPREKDKAYQNATAIAIELLGDRFCATNTYKFATALLALHHETAYTEVRQLEADSKFFRSLVVLWAGMFMVNLWTTDFRLALVCIALAAMCCWRYVERRWKANQRAFQYVVVINAISPDKTQA